MTPEITVDGKVILPMKTATPGGVSGGSEPRLNAAIVGEYLEEQTVGSLNKHRSRWTIYHRPRMQCVK